MEAPEQDCVPIKTDRQRGDGVLADRKSTNDIGGVAGFGSLRNFRTAQKLNRSIIVCDHNDDARHEQPDERGEVEIVRRAGILLMMTSLGKSR